MTSKSNLCIKLQTSKSKLNFELQSQTSTSMSNFNARLQSQTSKYRIYKTRWMALELRQWWTVWVCCPFYILPASGVSEMSWSKNCPNCMCMWVKLFSVRISSALPLLSLLCRFSLTVLALTSDLLGWKMPRIGEKSLDCA